MSISTVERLLADGAFDGGVVRFRGSLRITSAALDEFVAEHTVPGRLPPPSIGRSRRGGAQHAEGTPAALSEIERLRRLQASARDDKPEDER